MRFRTTSAVLVVAFALNACGGGADSPTAPTPQVSAMPRLDPRPDPPQVPGIRWNLTTIQTAVTGPGSKVCWRNPDGTRIDWLMAVQRTSEAVSFLYDVHNWPSDHVEHKGRVAGEHFIASSESQPGYFPCAGTQVEFVFEAEVSGQFSADGQALTAREVWTYKLTSGEAVSIAFDWVASRR
jgi:hypothetical protein